MAADDSKQGNDGHGNGAANGKKVAMLLANKSVGKLGDIGFWYAELTHPFHEFTLAGFQIELFSPDGGEVFGDGYSDPEHESGYSAHDIVSLGFKKYPKYNDLLKNTKKLSQLKIDDFDALFVCGGQSPMVTFYNNEAVFKIVSSFYESNKMTGLVCHGTCVLLKTKLANGKLLVDGKKWTGFANSEEDYADAASKEWLPKDDPHIQPFRIEDEAKKIKETQFVVGNLFEPFAIRDGNLVTGQQQESGRLAARLIIFAIKNEEKIDTKKQETVRGYN